MNPHDDIFLFGRDDWRLCRPSRQIFSLPFRQIFAVRSYFTAREIFVWCYIRLWHLFASLGLFSYLQYFFSPSVWTSARCANLPPNHLVWLLPVFSSSANFLTAQAYPKTRPVCICTRYKLFNECYFFQHYNRLYSTNSWASAIFIPTMIFLIFGKDSYACCTYALTLPPMFWWPCRQFFSSPVNFLPSFLKIGGNPPIGGPNAPLNN